MANDEHIARLRQGKEIWNAWRNEEPEVVPDLRGADLHGVDLDGFLLRGAISGGVTLRGADLSEANLSKAKLRGADLIVADLSRANLCGADLRAANLDDANLHAANLSDANFGGADLGDADLSDADLTNAYLNTVDFRGTILTGANLRGANLGYARFQHNRRLGGTDFSETTFFETIFADVDLSAASGLDTCIHDGPSSIDYRTFELSGQLPLNFLRGCGLPDNLIDYLPSLLNQPIQFYSCFISHSSKDKEFADRLYADLQNKGVRCWFAPHDLPIGARTRDEIDVAVRIRQKLLVILSENSINSDWVEEEVEIALEEERQREDRRTVLFPIRIDDAVCKTERAWARKLRRERNIGSFSSWKDYDAYQQGLKQLLRDLTIDQAGA